MGRFTWLTILADLHVWSVKPVTKEKNTFFVISSMNVHFQKMLQNISVKLVEDCLHRNTVYKDTRDIKSVSKTRSSNKSTCVGKLCICTVVTNNHSWTFFSSDSTLNFMIIYMQSLLVYKVKNSALLYT